MEYFPSLKIPFAYVVTEVPDHRPPCGMRIPEREKSLSALSHDRHFLRCKYKTVHCKNNKIFGKTLWYQLLRIFYNMILHSEGRGFESRKKAWKRECFNLCINAIHSLFVHAKNPCSISHVRPFDQVAGYSPCTHLWWLLVLWQNFVNWYQWNTGLPVQLSENRVSCATIPSTGSIDLIDIVFLLRPTRSRTSTQDSLVLNMFPTYK